MPGGRAEADLGDDPAPARLPAAGPGRPGLGCPDIHPSGKTRVRASAVNFLLTAVPAAVRY